MANDVRTEPAPRWLKRAGTVLLVLWAVIFVLGAMGELFGIELLRKATDFKRIFLR
jgi:hypothetical protein